MQRLLLATLVAAVVLGSVPSASAAELPRRSLDRRAVDRLSRALVDPDPAERIRAVRSLRSTDERGAELLVEALWESNPSVRDEVRDALVSMGPVAVPALVSGLQSPGMVNLPRRCAEILGKMGPEAEPAVPALVDALALDDTYVRYRAVNALAAIGEGAQPAAPALRSALLEDRAGTVRFAAATALGKIGDGESVPTLILSLETDPREHVRLCVIEALGELRATESIGPVTDALLHDEDPFVREAAATTLSRFGPAARPARDALTRALDDEATSVRDEARRAMTALDAPSR